MSEIVNRKLQEYIDLMDFKDEYFRKDFKNNVKFIKWAVAKMIKGKSKEDEIVDFIQSTIKIHTQIYC